MNQNIIFSDILWETFPIENVHGKQEEGDSTNQNIMISDSLWGTFSVEKIHGNQEEGDRMNQNMMISDILWENSSVAKVHGKQEEGDSMNQTIIRQPHHFSVSQWPPVGRLSAGKGLPLRLATYSLDSSFDELIVQFYCSRSFHGLF